LQNENIMLLTAVIIVLREVLEAALLISILTALSSMLGIARNWVGWSLGAGLCGAIMFAYYVDSISEWFAGVGQEVASATIQLVIYVLLCTFVSIMVLHRSGLNRQSGLLLKIVMACIVALAVTREGFEILVYVSSFSMGLRQLLTLLVGAAIGASIGISAGALTYYLLVNLRYPWSQAGGMGLLILVAAGLASQAAQLLIQADWLPSQLPVWDSSALIAEDSVTGQLLYATIGYEATPTAIQAGCHIGAGLLLLGVAAASLACCKRGGESADEK
jgi:high-affinity iron transporter